MTKTDNWKIESKKAGTLTTCRVCGTDIDKYWYFEYDRKNTNGQKPKEMSECGPCYFKKTKVGFPNVSKQK